MPVASFLKECRHPPVVRYALAGDDAFACVSPICMLTAVLFAQRIAVSDEVTGSNHTLEVLKRDEDAVGVEVRLVQIAP